MFIKSPVLCCGENITFHQVAKFSVPLHLQCMSAAVIALTRWEPRIALDAIDVVWKAGGRAGVTLSGTVMQTMQNVELTITLRE
ncbi:hypothetical protein NXS14_07340 [Escherichia coli]|uniref:hypothetical protein n=1 Tax=Escherichia coli TaxID=562 RepID=UPI0003EE6B3E|nr:hypothetical protein [Escherichia coli]